MSFVTFTWLPTTLFVGFCFGPEAKLTRLIAALMRNRAAGDGHNFHGGRGASSGEAAVSPSGLQRIAELVMPPARHALPPTRNDGC
jgi:hypothetical protein